MTYKENNSMEVAQIVNEIFFKGYENEVFLELSRRMVQEKRALEDVNAEQRATLRVIRKITTDKKVKRIFEGEEN